jgi:selenocysteine lyase/cysteine desulfurase
MSDLHGIQVRGGCACAGPYGHALLGIDTAQSEALRDRIMAGDVVDKPGFLRFNLSYLTTEAEFRRIADALSALPEAADRHRGRYCHEANSGTFRAA